MRTVIYARFSSDNQNPRSLADQIALCRERAEREGWPVVAVFEDAAISGAAGIGEEQRPGLNAMLRLVDAGGIAQVLAESTDRVTRHVADAHLVRERIEYAGARLFTLFDGTVTPMIGLVKGFMDAQFRTDLAARVKRGQRGTVEQGRAAGGLSYGYRRANRLDDRGDLIAGLREIRPDQAEIVQRIFKEYAAGMSPATIAGRLNAEGVPPSRRGFWRPKTILGEVRTGHGLLRNRLYIGKLVYGRTRVVVNPVTRRRLMKPSADAPIEHDVPQLRIIDDALWATVQERLSANSGDRPERKRRPKHPLSGLAICGVCGAGWTKVTGDHWGCSRFRNGGRDCANNRMINSRLFQARVLADLKAGMLAPDVVAAYVREYHRDFARRSADLGRDRAKLEQRRAEADRRVKRLMEAFVGGGSEFAEVRDALAAARDERDRLGRELASLEALPTVLTLHPRLEEEYRRQVEDLETALLEPAAALEAVPRFRAMIARIIVCPAATKRGIELKIVRQIDEVLALATSPRIQSR